MSVKARLGWGPFFEEQVRAPEKLAGGAAELWFARVIDEQRGLYRLAGDFDGVAAVSGRFRHEAQSPADFPAVGDWVGVKPLRVGRGVIHCRLDRRSTVSRAAAGRAVGQQVIAANVDTMLVVTTPTEDLNARRLERYLPIIWDAGAVPVVVVNKADLVADVQESVGALRERLPFVDVVAVSALTGDPVRVLVAYLEPARTIALVGSSGVGKSTLINRLLGSDALKVGVIRDRDGRGRHTTSARRLVVTPSGALLIDTPGMRELEPWVEAAAIDSAFDDINRLASACRFTNCTHQEEPGCAVRSAIAEGVLDQDRLESYRHLIREVAFEERKRDKAAAAAAKRRWKQASRAQRALYRDRERLE